MNKRATFWNRFIAIAALLMPGSAFAQSAMPWESPLSHLSQAFTGTTATLLLTIAFAGAGLAFAFGEQGGFARKAAGVVFGGAIAFGATNLVGLLR